MHETQKLYDVVVVGGGAAGLAGALSLGRARRSVLVVDGGQPRNAPAAHMQNYLGSDGLPPAELLARARAEVTGYGVRIAPTEVVGARRSADGRFTIDLADGSTVRARRLLIATGVTDELPAVPGVAQRWGRDVLHCPYCHGWEVRDQPIGVLGTGPMATHIALLMRQWSADVVLFRHTAPELSTEQAAQVAARGVSVVDGEVRGLEVHEDRLTGVRLRSGELVERQAVVVTPRISPRLTGLDGLGLVPSENPAGTHLAADASGATAVPGVWAAGNVTDPMAQVIIAAAAGSKAGAMINADLITEDIDLAMAPEFSARAEAQVCERVLADSRHGL
ncbi:NAD(P)/FAD-dependent oxidoreductase [Kutzneria albida]|uniref:FAD-dependent pyridine nucleotide-disulfide oxidoreductase n=1 Tax=Kutzneria albida DSM 43870 TaxID=1449976 RepID=W5WGB9_9PSEU|nr:NAD(P)/FAD-dependent oxidoreductase [Kutzneria albida]AHH97204.1 FAD-dependent pyridine nucleotide-disulfide oxidoreductase [Kutzneria albida DSM 43870]